MKIMVTGSEGRLCSGFLIPYLKKQGYDDVTRFDKVLGDDMLIPSQLSAKMKNIDVVIHAAGIAGPIRAKNKDLFTTVNTKGSQNVIESSIEHGVKRFIFFGSMSYYGVDAWMRFRHEKGPVTGGDVAIPFYLPIDEDHPSILKQNLKRMTDYNGSHYGLSKAKVEEFAAKATANNPMQFISLRFSGFSTNQLTQQRFKHCIQTIRDKKLNFRKQYLYHLAGITTEELVGKSVCAAMIEANPLAAYNVCESMRGLGRVIEAYFPGVKTRDDRIFSNDRMKALFKRNNISCLLERDGWTI